MAVAWYEPRWEIEMVQDVRSVGARNAPQYAAASDVVPEPQPDAFAQTRAEVDSQVDRTPLLSESEVARLLRMEVKTLQNLRHMGSRRAPPCLQLPGRRGVIY